MPNNEYTISDFEIQLDDSQGLLTIEQDRESSIIMCVALGIFFVIWDAIIIIMLIPIIVESDTPFILVPFLLLIPVFIILPAFKYVKLAFFGNKFTFDKRKKALFLNDKEICPMSEIKDVIFQATPITGYALDPGDPEYSYSLILQKWGEERIILISYKTENELAPLGETVADLIGCELTKTKTDEDAEETTYNNNNAHMAKKNEILTTINRDGSLLVIPRIRIGKVALFAIACFVFSSIWTEIILPFFNFKMEISGEWFEIAATLAINWAPFVIFLIGMIFSNTVFLKKIFGDKYIIDSSEGTITLNKKIIGQIKDYEKVVIRKIMGGIIPMSTGQQTETYNQSQTSPTYQLVLKSSNKDDIIFVEESSQLNGLWESGQIIGDYCGKQITKENH